MKNPIVDMSNSLHAEHAAQMADFERRQAEAQARTDSVFNAILSHAPAFGGKPASGGSTAEQKPAGENAKPSGESVQAAGTTGSGEPPKQTKEATNTDKTTKKTVGKKGGKK